MITILEEVGGGRGEGGGRSGSLTIKITLKPRKIHRLSSHASRDLCVLQEMELTMWTTALCSSFSLPGSVKTSR